MLINISLTNTLKYNINIKKDSIQKRMKSLNIYWSQHPESNRGPSPYHGDALPTELCWQTTKLILS